MTDYIKHPIEHNFQYRLDRRIMSILVSEVANIKKLGCLKMFVSCKNNMLTKSLYDSTRKWPP